VSRISFAINNESPSLQEESPEIDSWYSLSVEFREYALAEILKHKWIESEKHRRDMGVVAVKEWFHKYWWKFCRYRRIEHIEGDRLWKEFDDIEFAMLIRIVVERDLLNSILNRMKGRGTRFHDNLDIFDWARENPQINIDHVHAFLLVIDIDKARFPEPKNLEALLSA